MPICFDKPTDKIPYKKICNRLDMLDTGIHPQGGIWKHETCMNIGMRQKRNFVKHILLSFWLSV